MHSDLAEYKSNRGCGDTTYEMRNVQVALIEGDSQRKREYQSQLNKQKAQMTDRRLFQMFRFLSLSLSRFLCYNI